jgi:hypothetical protein
VIDKVTIFQDKYHSKHTINGLFINLFSVIDKVTIFQVKGPIVISYTKIVTGCANKDK